MEPSAFAVWLDTALAAFDQSVLQAVHQIQQSGADLLLGPLARLMALLGKGGAALILLGLALLCRKRTRRYGAGILLALALGALCTNVLLKPLVARPRPYADPAGLPYRWWLEAGAAMESDASFPSGHTTAAMSAMTALFWLGNRQRSWTAFLFAAAMAVSRLYLVVHYPTDVLAGLIVGFAAGSLAAWLVRRFRRPAVPAP